MLDQGGCPKNILAIKDALEMLEGKWKLPILMAMASGGKRFNEIVKEIPGISDKMLSKELKVLEINKLVKREASEALSPAVAYSITPHGATLQHLLTALYQWGMQHRKEVLGL